MSDKKMSSRLEMMSEKQISRIENKKRKTEAFLALVKSTDLPKPSKIGKYQFDGKSPEEIMNMKTEMVKLREQKSSVIKQKVKKFYPPKFELTLKDIPSCDGTLVLHMVEIQKLLIFAITEGMLGSTRPWCKLSKPALINRVGLVVIDGVSITDFKQHQEAFPNLQNLFDTSVEVLTPDCYGMNVSDNLLKIPMTRERVDKHIRKFGEPNSIKGPVEHFKSNPIITSQSKMIENRTQLRGESSNIDEEFEARKIEHKKKIGITEFRDVFPRTWLLLNVHQLLCEGFVLPGTAHEEISSNEYVYTTTGNYLPITDRSPMFAVDCEMVMTVANKNELARVSVISEDGVCIYDTLVKPFNRVKNYLTKYSGITKSMLDPVKTRLKEVQRTIQRLLPPDAILVGQSLSNDLKALKMFHPYVIDTSVIYNQTGQRARKTGLARLTSIFFGSVIQADSSGHNPVEDATSTLNLVLLKLSKGFEFGDVLMSYRASGEPQSVLSAEEQTAEICYKSFQTHCEKKTAVTKQRENQISKSNSASEASIGDSNNSAMNSNIQGESTGNQNKTIQSWRDEDKMKVFYSCESRLYDDFFAKIKIRNKTGVIIDREINATHESKYVNYEYCSNNEDLIKIAAETIDKYDFTYMRLEGYRKLMANPAELDSTLNERLDYLKQLDSNVKDLHDVFPNNAAFIVLLTGRKTPVASNHIENALCLMKVIQSNSNS